MANVVRKPPALHRAQSLNEFNYSYRSAIIGSTLVARRAGM